MSPETLDLFRLLLDGVRLDVSSLDFEKVALQIIQARKELDAASKLVKE